MYLIKTNNKKKPTKQTKSTLVLFPGAGGGDIGQLRKLHRENFSDIVIFILLLLNLSLSNSTPNITSFSTTDINNETSWCYLNCNTF